MSNSNSNGNAVEMEDQPTQEMDTHPEFVPATPDRKRKDPPAAPAAPKSKKSKKGSHKSSKGGGKGGIGGRKSPVAGLLETKAEKKSESKEDATESDDDVLIMPPPPGMGKKPAEGASLEKPKAKKSKDKPKYALWVGHNLCLECTTFWMNMTEHSVIGHVMLETFNKMQPTHNHCLDCGADFIGRPQHQSGAEFVQDALRT